MINQFELYYCNYIMKQAASKAIYIMRTHLEKTAEKREYL
jgi:hypothetical protein